MEKIQSIGLVLYNPLSLSKLALNKLINQNKDLHIFIYLNSIINNKVQIEIDNLIINHNNVIILGDKINIGLSKSFNIICKYALDLKLNNILLIDQDTIIFENMFSNFIIPIKDDDKTVCINIISGQSDKIQIKKNKGFIINNGNIIFLNSLKKIGFFNEKYFVELVDYELQFRIKKLGYNYYLLHGSGLFNHSTNQGYNIINIFGLNVKLKIYSNRRILEYFNNSKLLLKTLLFDLKIFSFFQFLSQSIIQILIITIHKLLWKIYK